MRSQKHANHPVTYASKPSRARKQAVQRLYLPTTLIRNDVDVSVRAATVRESVLRLIRAPTMRQWYGIGMMLLARRSPNTDSLTLAVRTILTSDIYSKIGSFSPLQDGEGLGVRGVIYYLSFHFSHKPRRELFRYSLVRKLVRMRIVRISLVLIPEAVIVPA